MSETAVYETTKIQHGIAEAFYTVKPYGVYPWIVCLCDWETNHAANWQDAGEQFDEHLAAEVTAK